MNEPMTTNAPICKTVNCKKPLTYLEDSNCWRCLICNPIRKTAPIIEKKRAFLDVKMTEERVAEMIEEAFEKGTITYIAMGNLKRPETAQVVVGTERFGDMVREELENWHIPKPSVTRDEIKDLTEEVKGMVNNLDLSSGSETSSVGTHEFVEIKEETWLQKAKRLSVPTHYEVDGVMAGGMRKKVDILADIADKEASQETKPDKKTYESL